MLRSIGIIPDRERSGRLDLALQSVGGFAMKRTLDVYPAVSELLRVLRASGAEVLFLSFEEPERARVLIKALEEELPDVRIVAVHSAGDSDALRETMRLGIRESLWEPFDKAAVTELLSDLKEHFEGNRAKRSRRSQLLSFLPSKPGVGTSTIALNVGTALAARPGNSVLLADFDLSVGMIRFLLRLSTKSSVIEAIELASDLDSRLWAELVSRRKGLDILHSGDLKPDYYADLARLEGFLGFLRRTYKFVCMDHSGNFERHSLDLLQDSTAIFLVCTPEVPSVHLAREKLDFLRQLDMHSRVSVILNRVSKKALFSPQQVEDFLGVPVAHAFANDHEGVNRAVAAGTAVAASSEFGMQLARFSARLDGAVPDETASQQRTGWGMTRWQLKNV